MRFIRALLFVLPVLPVLAFLPVAGCGAAADGDITVVFSPCMPLVLEPAPDTSPPELDAVRAAIELWRPHAGARLTLDMVEGPHLPVRFATAATAFRGLYDDERAQVVVNRGLVDPHERAVVLAHEIGHAFGLVHVAARTRRSVMNGGNLSVEPNAADADALAALWGSCVGDP